MTKLTQFVSMGHYVPKHNALSVWFAQWSHPMQGYSQPQCYYQVWAVLTIRR